MARNVIGQRLIWIVLVISLSLLALSTAISIPVDFYTRMQLINKEIDNIVKAQIPGLEEGLWNYDTRLVDALVSGLAIYPFIDDIHVSDSSGQLISSHGRNHTDTMIPGDGCECTHQYPLYRHERGKEPVLIGWLCFNINSKKIYSEIIRPITNTILNQIVLIILQSMLILILISRMITRHLAQIARQLKKYETGTGHTELVLGRKNRNDELSFLVDALNSMHEKLDNSLSIERATKQNLEQSLEEKKILLQEIYHRTKNNMQLIAALLDIQSLSLEDEGAKTLFNEMTARILTMALVHQKLYESQDLSRLDLGEYIEELLNEIRIANIQKTKDIDFKLQLEQGHIAVFDVAIPVGLALNELISNSIKHAFPEGKQGSIEVSLEKGSVEDECIIQVRDNGRGFPKGFDMNRDSKLGLQTVINLIEQLYGRVVFDSTSGVQCTMILRKNAYKPRV